MIDQLDVQALELLANQGDLEAQLNLGRCYANGEGVDQDYSQAVELWRQAAAQGNASAQFFLGLCYASGEGVDQDHSQAVEWYRQAAAQGNADAQYLLGLCYTNGQGVDQDHSQAVEWYRQAAAQGNASAQFFLGLCYANGEGVDQDNSIAVEWCHKFAEQNAELPECLNGFIFCLLGGVFSIAEHYTESFEWYRKAAERGDALAQFSLSDCYRTGKGVEKNEIISIEWCRKSAEQNIPMAQFVLGCRYALGEGVPTDEKMAVSYCTQAAQSGLFHAAILLAFLLEKCHTTDPETNQNSDYWLAKAAVNQLPLEQPNTESMEQLDTDFIQRQLEKQIVEYLQNKAKIFLPAKVALAHLIDTKSLSEPLDITSEQLLDQACIQNDLAAFYYRGVKHQDNQEFDKALKCFQQLDQLIKTRDQFTLAQAFTGAFFSELAKEVPAGFVPQLSSSHYSPDLKNWLGMLAHEKARFIETQQHQAQLLKAEEEKRKTLEDLMALFAHKFRGPLDSIDYNSEHQGDIRLYREAVATMRGLLDVFSLISTDPERLKQRLRADNTGESDLRQVLRQTLANVIQQLLSTAGREKMRQHYLAYAVRMELVPETTTRQMWLKSQRKLEETLQQQWEDAWSTLLRDGADLEQLQQWLGEHFAPLEFTGFEQASIRFQSYGMTYSLLTIVLSELLINALKYYSSPTQEALHLHWQLDGDCWLLQMTNPSTRPERQITKGSGKGHHFLTLLAERIEGRFTRPLPNDQYATEFFFPHWALTAAE